MKTSHQLTIGLLLCLGLISAVFPQADTALVADSTSTTSPVETTASDQTTAPGQSIKDDRGLTTTTASSTESTIGNLQQQAWSLSTNRVVWAVIVALIGFTIIRYLSRLLERLGERWIKFRHTIKGLVPILRIVGWIIILYIIIVDLLAPPIATLVAVTASAGIAVGFASQDILKNIFGGVMILFDRPFQVGDKIQVGTHYGEVVGIGLRTVRIVSPDDSLVSIPNSEIVNTSVSNSNSGAPDCQVVAEIYLQPDVDVNAVRSLAFEAAATSQYVYLNKPIQVLVKNEMHQGQSLLKLRLKAYVLDIRYEFAFASQMTETLMSSLSKEQLPFKPTYD